MKRGYTEANIKARFKSIGEVPLSDSMTAVRLPVNIHQLIKSSIKTPSDRAAWLRRVICEAAEQELATDES